MITLLLNFCVALVFGVLLTAVAQGQISKYGIGQAVREDGPESHIEKTDTPTMGGIAIICVFAVLVAAASAYEARFTVRSVLVVAVTIGFALIGLIDDLQKAATGDSTGWRARYKIILEILLASLFVAAVVWEDSFILGIGATRWHTGMLWFWAPLGMFVIVGAANSVNLTDGLDGLAAGLTTICAIGLAGVLMLRGDWEMALASAILAGAATGFLWFNAHPASIFMGDIGSLGLGAALGCIAVAGAVEFIFALIAAVFVWETLSVIIQVISFQRFGRRVFKMSPFHHHLELCGWEEPTIVIRLWLVGLLLASAGWLVARFVFV
ncbi:MAG: phospho-N-acetylmuramoyl-pentapeptide-transferase [Armatimonadota bacterium]